VCEQVPKVRNLWDLESYLWQYLVRKCPHTTQLSIGTVSNLKAKVQQTSAPNGAIAVKGWCASLKDSLNRVLKLLLNMDLLLAGITLAALVFVTFIGVLMRYFFNAPFVWQEEVQLWCVVWMVFLGAGAAFRSGSHVAIEFVVERLPQTLRKAVGVLGYFVVIFVLTYLSVYGWQLLIQLLRTGKTTNVLHIPYPVIYITFPLGCLLMILNYSLAAIPAFLRSPFRSEGEGGEGTQT